MSWTPPTKTRKGMTMLELSSPVELLLARALFFNARIDWNGLIHEVAA